MRRTPYLYVPLVLALALAGCASEDTSTAPELTPSSTPTPPSEPATVPVSGFDADCDDVFPLDSLRSLVDPGLSRIESRIGFGYESESAIVQASGVVCEWGTEASDARVRVVALPGAVDEFENAAREFREFEYVASRYAELPILDGGFGSCRPGYQGLAYTCDWSVLAGDTWLSIVMDNLAESDVTLPTGSESPPTITTNLDPNLDGAATALVESAATGLYQSRNNVALESLTAPSCDQAVDSAGLATEIGGPTVAVVDYVSSRVMQNDGASPNGMWRYAYQRLGFASCSIEVGEEPIPINVLVAPHSMWMLDQTSDDARTAYSVPEAPGIASGCFAFSDSDQCRLTFVDSDGAIIVSTANREYDRGLLTPVFEHIRTALGW